MGIELICTETFIIPLSDINPNDNYVFEVKKGSVWVIENYDSFEDSQIELTNDSGDWLLVSSQTLKKCFDELRQKREKKVK
ncbi:hypothetical protein [Enterococcus mundtii]|uniref:hypothetical protein n=1 Tax=Enterococcus mundtii TaxID=53346 RepID=UPI000E00C220|nr:hypothetical protein [Enterococcus mundtii]STE38103.1 Uncharacterised protein [Enterococcus mundtii]